MIVYDSEGSWFDAGIRWLERMYVLNASGIPTIIMSDGRRVVSPTQVVQLGLGYFGRQEYGKARLMGDWLLANQVQGKWMFPFSHDVGSKTLQPPWCSSISQGQGASLLTRLGRTTRDTRYFNAAIAAVRVLGTPFRSGGLLTSFLGSPMYPWLELYPTDPPGHVYNGHLVALFGLWDVYSALGDKASLRLFWDCYLSALAALPFFDNGGASPLYDAFHITIDPGVPPHSLDQPYRLWTAMLLDGLCSIREDSRLMIYPDLWRNYGG